MEEEAAVTVKHPHTPDRRGGAIFQCFCKGAGKEAELAVGTRPQSHLGLLRGCDSADPDGGKAVAPAGSLGWAPLPC